MNPRVAFRTHYQVNEPAYMEFLVKLCTSPVQSTYREVVAQKLAREISRRREKSFNEDAAAYAVDLAKDLDLITENQTWTDKGQLVHLVGEIRDCNWEAQMSLSVPEKLLHFRIFLEGDGAALVFLAGQLLKAGTFGGSDMTWNSLAKEMFIHLFSEYLTISNNTADRVRLRREIERIKTADYRGNSGSHKIFIHLQTLYRLGLVERPNASGRRVVYRLPERPQGANCGLQILTEEVPNVFTLEQIIKNHGWIEVAAKVFEIHCASCPESDVDLPLVASFYLRITATGVPLCSLSTLVEAMQIELLSQRSQLLPHKIAIKAIEDIQKQNPKDVRFHVDRRGQPAFLKLSKDIVRESREESVLS